MLEAVHAETFAFAMGAPGLPCGVSSPVMLGRRSLGRVARQTRLGHGRGRFALPYEARARNGQPLRIQLVTGIAAAPR
jgi:hypothetical protein